MQRLKTRAVSFVTALLLVFTLLPLLPDGMMTAEAAERRFSFLDQKTGLEWVFTLENGGSGDAHIISVRDTLGRDEDSDASNDITRITVPETVTDNVYGYTHNVTHIACELDGNDFTPTFAKFKKLKRVDLPKTLKTLGQRTFYEHETLEDIYIETGVTLIGAQAFFGCKKLKAVNIPASVTTISNHAFYRCTSLSRIYIPKTVTDIGSNSFEEIADDATIYGYTGTKAEEYANHWNINFEALDAIVDKVPYSIPAFSGSITFTLRNGNTVTRTDGISSTIMGNVDRSKDATIAADKTPDGMTFEGYEIKYDISFTDNTAGSTKPAYSETFTQTPEENTFSFHLPDEAYEKMFGYIVLWNSNKSRYRFSGTVTITPIFKKIPHTLKIVNGTATLDPSKGSGAQITATEGDVVYLYGKKPDDGNYYFTGWTVDDEDIELKNPDSSWTTFTMPARDVTLTCNFTKGQKYGLYVDGVQVMTENAKDILGNGVFTFNENTKTLYINDDYSTENSTLISCNYSFNDTLTITPQKDVTLSAKSHVMRLGGIDGIITGENKLTLKSGYGIYLEDSDFRIINANVEIDADYQGIGGYSSSSNYLTVSNSAVHVKSEKGEEVTTTAGMYVNGAVCNMNMGVTLVNEKITVPASWEEIKKSARSYIKDKSTGKPAKEVTFAPTAHTHTLKKTAAKAGSCLEDGNTAYWECTDCGLYFGDKDGKTPVAKDSWVIERSGHKLTWNPAKNATCTEDGHKGSYDCSVCGKHFNSSDKFTINETQEWLRPKLGHSMSESYHTNAKQPTFYDKGNIEYWKCTRCSKYFSDKQCTTQLDEKSLEIPVLEPKDLGTLTVDFTKGDFKFNDAAQRELIYYMFYIVNWGHSTGRYYINQRVRVDGPKSGYNVNVDDDHSTGADQNYDIKLKDDQSGFTLLESRNLSDTTHTIDLNKDAAEFRAICDYIYQQTKKNGCYSKVKFVFPDKHVHTIKRVEAKAPSCTEDGNFVYWVCTGCNKAFSDSAGTKPTTAETQVRKATGHKWGDWRTTKEATTTTEGKKERTCSVCKKTETQTIPKKSTTEITTTRLAGKGRYETAAKISQAEFKQADTVVLAYSLNYADALAGMSLATKLNAPILLTNTKTLDATTLAEIKRLKAKNVIILGGTGAISDEVKKELENNGLTTERIAGASRFGTATAIAEKLNEAPTDVFFVYAFNSADALSVSPIAASKNAPIIYLTTKGDLHPDTAAYLAKLKKAGSVKNAYVIGGTGVISNDMMNKAGNALGVTPTRVFGKDRFATCVAVNEQFKDTLNGDMLCVATGMDFPDALAGGVYAAINKAPLFLINGKLKTPQLTDEQKAYLKTKAAAKITAFGGVGVVPDNHIEDIVKNSI